MANPKITEPPKRAPGATRRIPRLQLKSHRIGSGALTALGGVLMALELPFLGLPAACIGGGYLLGSYLLSGALKAGDEDIDNWAKVLDERERTLTARAGELKEDKAAAKALLAQIEAKMRETERQARQVELDLKAKYEQRLAQTAGVMEADYQKRLAEAIAAHKASADEAIAAADAHALGRIQHHKSRYIADYKTLHEEIDSLKKQLEQRDAYLLEEFNKRIESYRTGYSEIQQAIDIQGRNVGEARAAFEAQYEALLDERDRLTDELRRLKAPRRFQFKGLEYDAANEVQQFMAERGVILACHSVGRNHYGSVPLHFEALSPQAVVGLKANARDLQLRLGLPEEPQVEVRDGGLIEVLVQLSREAAPKKKIAIIDPPLTRLEAAIDESIHVRIAAPSGSGKSVTLGNLINYLATAFVPPHKISDPKVTDPEVWGDHKPTHYSFECLDHVYGLAADVMDRVEQAKRAVRAGEPMPSFDPQFHVIDELELVNGLVDCSDDKRFTTKAFKANVKIMLKAGREHKLKLLFVTQSPLPASLNLNKDDLYNTSSVLLGNCISMALDGYSEKGALLADVPREKIAQLKAEYEARLARGDKFIFLFYNPAKPLDIWFGRCPSPGYYASTAAPIAPDTAIVSTPDLRGGAPLHVAPVRSHQSPPASEVRASTAAPVAIASAPPSTAGNTVLASLLKQGTHCPDCGSHSASYRKRKPNGKGNVTLNCRNQDCTTKTFTWNVLESGGSA